MPKRLATFLTLIWVMTLFVGVWAVPGHCIEKSSQSQNPALNIKLLEKKLDDFEKQMESHQRERRRLLSQLQTLGRDIEKLKSDKTRGFLSNVRLQKLLASHLELSNQLESLEKQIKDNQGDQEKIKTQLWDQYNNLIHKAVESMEKEKNKNRSIALVQEYFRLLEVSKKYQPKTAADIKFTPFIFVLDPLDGPREINEKIDLLRDRIKKLQQLINNIEQEIDRLENEKNLSQEMSQMIEEGNLFEEGVLFAPSPRLYPVKRPEGSGIDDGSGNADAQSYNEAGVHTSPVDNESTTEGGRILSAFDREIKYLEKQKTYLNQVIRELEEKVKEFMRKAKERS